MHAMQQLDATLPACGTLLPPRTLAPYASSSTIQGFASTSRGAARSSPPAPGPGAGLPGDPDLSRLCITVDLDACSRFTGGVLSSCLAFLRGSLSLSPFLSLSLSLSRSIERESLRRYRSFSLSLSLSLSPLPSRSRSRSPPLRLSRSSSSSHPRLDDLSLSPYRSLSRLRLLS